MMEDKWVMAKVGASVRPHPVNGRGESASFQRFAMTDDPAVLFLSIHQCFTPLN